jgi:hypothetical protein
LQEIKKIIDLTSHKQLRKTYGGGDYVYAPSQPTNRVKEVPSLCCNIHSVSNINGFPELQYIGFSVSMSLPDMSVLQRCINAAQAVLTIAARICVRADPVYIDAAQSSAMLPFIDPIIALKK